MPERFANAPSVLPGLELYYKAWLDLMWDRDTGMGFGPLRWSTVMAWAKHHELSGEQTEALHCHMRALDQVFLVHHAKESK